MSENVFVGADSFRRLLLGAAGGTSCKATMRRPKPFCASLTRWTN